MAKMIHGLGAGSFPIYKELFKSIVKALTDRVMPVRSAAAKVICWEYVPVGDWAICYL
jgi:hypothetical protein